jgi:phosphoribosylformylglycinamidine (FGAM) synthase-like amidotransferase family enzyme
VRVAVLREEGSNGDREMAAAVYAAGMEPWDVHMSDLLEGRASLDDFQGLIFVGGFRWVWVGGWVAMWVWVWVWVGGWGGGRELKASACAQG